MSEGAVKNIKYKITPFIIKDHKIGSEVIIFVLCSFSMKFIMLIMTKMPTTILLIRVKMPTFVGILTIMSRINTISECLKQEKLLIFCILPRVGVIKIVIVINCNLITFSKVIACNCN